ncbi:MAG TPA: hypothetical protein DIT64_16465 [Verrucomicrobiales bacterium]|nr:hypothetical protein [Verrucomicrobiales bacterium]
MLVERNYTELEQLSGGVRLSAQAIERAVSQYGRTLCRLPAERWRYLDVVEITGVVPARFSVRVDLWTVEEGRSDLSLELTLIDYGKHLAVEIDDLHVL